MLRKRFNSRPVRATANDPVNVAISTGSAESTFQVVVDPFTPPSNDTCASPQALTAGTPVSVSFVNAFDDPFPEVDAGSPTTLPDGGFVCIGDGGQPLDGGSLSRCGYGNPDVVFSFTPATTGRFEFEGPGGLHLGEGACGESCFRVGYQSLIVDLLGGRTYWLIAEGEASQAGFVRVDPLLVFRR